ncbi:putative F-box protein At3g16210 [Miscanthus floridulus]|uniref:putative F-box protein At3g16210 n=1 Tax=Miscanthus floridulus TaxID=154761 RepID=UPI0034592190
MEEAPNKRNALASLTEDVIFEILCRLFARSLFYCKCVCRSYKNLISDPNNHKKLPQTMADLFYDSEDDNRNFTSVIRGVRPCSLEFLPFNIKNVAISDCCNGLILYWCLRVDGYRYVIYNPMTQKFKILPPSTHDVGHAVSEARLAFDLTASSHFHVIEYVDVNAVCVGVEIYSSQTAVWIYKEFK